jgi:hypothetical protein
MGVSVVLAGCALLAPTPKLEKGGIYLNLSADAVLIEPNLSKLTNGVSREEALNRSSREEIVEALNSYVDSYVGSQVRALFLNVNYQRACFDSQVMESYWNLPDPEKEITGWPRMFWETKKKGVDPFAVCIARCRADRISPWVSIRMNDHHYFDIPSRINRLWLDHPELRTRPPNGLFNYGKQEVREYYKAFVREVLETYDVDGVELDWMRTQTLFPDDKIAEGLPLLNQFMREIREMTQAKARERRHPIRIAVRVPVTPEIGRRYGLDAVSWAQEGLTDLVILSNWFTPTNFDIPVERWKREIGPAASCLVLPGADAALCLAQNKTIKQMNGTIEAMRGFAVSAFSRGADALYIFNNFMIPYKTQTVHPDGKVTTSSDRKEALRELGSLSTSLGKPRTHVLTFTAPDLKPEPKAPWPLPPGEAKAFDLHIGPKPEGGRCVAHLGLDAAPGVAGAALSVTVNGAVCRALGDLPRDPRYKYDNTRIWHVVKGVAETGARVMAFEVPTSALKDGYNRVAITNGKTEAQALTWLELQLNP